MSSKAARTPSVASDRKSRVSVHVQLGFDGRAIPLETLMRGTRGLGPSMAVALAWLRLQSRPVTTRNVPVHGAYHVLERLERRGLVERYKRGTRRSLCWLAAEHSEDWRETAPPERLPAG